ncbi:phospholipase A2 hemilipin-like [Liolophura sinensis]|uniref:phospholipase A2 hemilipin-like n=1 Tax=Liolophura sinensis TaxID=3198878 RepID=UPI003158CDEB
MMKDAFTVVIISCMLGQHVVTSVRVIAHVTTDGRLTVREIDHMRQVVSCEVYTPGGAAERELAGIPSEFQFLTDDFTFQSIVDSCQLPESGPRHKRSPEIIFPGTKWCGAGTAATNYDDLGVNQETDKCCRTHDHCPVNLESGEHSEELGLTNNYPYTISDCKCEEEFKQCLQNVGSVSANTLEIFYFNTLRLPCIKKGFPEKCSGIWIF